MDSEDRNRMYQGGPFHPCWRIGRGLAQTRRVLLKGWGETLNEDSRLQDVLGPGPGSAPPPSFREATVRGCPHFSNRMRSEKRTKNHICLAVQLVAHHHGNEDNFSASGGFVVEEQADHSLLTDGKWCRIRYEEDTTGHRGNIQGARLWLWPMAMGVAVGMGMGMAKTEKGAKRGGRGNGNLNRMGGE